MNGLTSISANWQAATAVPSTTTVDSLQTSRTPPRDSVREVNPRACLVYIYPDGARIGTRYSLTDNSVVIGRKPDCHIRDEDPSVSRAHALITCSQDGNYHVSDLESTNGTFVNDSCRVNNILRDGDYLRVGNCIYRFLAGANVETKYREEIYRLTMLDGLTQVANRRFLNEFLVREVARAVRHNRPLALVLVDIDNLKAVKDRMGSLAGDLTLRELCSRVQKVIGPDELLARYTGEQFAIVLPESTCSAARRKAESILKVVTAKPFSFGGRSYSLTVSLGVSVTGGVQSTVADLLHAADGNLIQAKLPNRNRVAVS